MPLPRVVVVTRLGWLSLCFGEVAPCPRVAPCPGMVPCHGCIPGMRSAGGGREEVTVDGLRSLHGSSFVSTRASTRRSSADVVKEILEAILISLGAFRTSLPNRLSKFPCHK